MDWVYFSIYVIVILADDGQNMSLEDRWMNRVQSVVFALKTGIN